MSVRRAVRRCHAHRPRCGRSLSLGHGGLTPPRSLRVSDSKQLGTRCEAIGWHTLSLRRVWRSPKDHGLRKASDRATRRVPLQDIDQPPERPGPPLGHSHRRSHHRLDHPTRQRPMAPVLANPRTSQDLGLPGIVGESTMSRVASDCNIMPRSGHNSDSCSETFHGDPTVVLQIESRRGSRSTFGRRNEGYRENRLAES